MGLIKLSSEVIEKYIIQSHDPFQHAHAAQWNIAIILVYLVYPVYTTVYRNKEFENKINRRPYPLLIKNATENKIIILSEYLGEEEIRDHDWKNTITKNDDDNNNHHRCRVIYYVRFLFLVC